MLSDIISYLEHKTIGIWGFGKEGKSSYEFIKRHLPLARILIFDDNKKLETTLRQENNPLLEWYLGDSFIEKMTLCDIIIKSPGIPLHKFSLPISVDKITSQTALFLLGFKDITIGITGTKGKSTTTSLIYHILSSYSPQVHLVGNIGIPALDVADSLTTESIVVYEMSCHQLEGCPYSPHYAVLLNLFEEHLDYYTDYTSYQEAKLSIFYHQNKEDYSFYCSDNKLLTNRIETITLTTIPTSYCFDDFAPLHLDTHRIQLQGNHNYSNIVVAYRIAELCRIPEQDIKQAIYQFKGLPHRLEYVDIVNHVTFYNDSISTIPATTIEALKTLKKVNTLILGGFDRGIDYTPLIDYLNESLVEQLILVGAVGRRIQPLLSTTNKTVVFLENYKEVMQWVQRHAKPHTICLLSPAASSYDMFKNFEERGDYFKQLIKEMKR